MKIKRIFAHNKKKAFILETKLQNYEYPFSELTIIPTLKDPVVSVYSDSEIGYEGFTYELLSGKTETIHLDSVLSFHKDPEYICELLLHQLTIKAQKAFNAKKITKRSLARKLKTSPQQLYRLLDASFYGKSIDQMVKLLHALGYSIDIRTEKLVA